jgi:hypothetical protein
MVAGKILYPSGISNNLLRASMAFIVPELTSVAVDIILDKTCPLNLSGFLETI